jgi:glycosyltransferase involved in cell wall biosynthesis
MQRSAPLAHMLAQSPPSRPDRSHMPVKVLIVSFYFPPAGGGGVQRWLRISGYLPERGIETHVLAPDDPRWIQSDPDVEIPAGVHVHRAHFVGPSGIRPAERLRGVSPLQRLWRQALLTPRRLLLPDENAAWLLTALPAARRIVRNEGIDVVITTSPPPSVHLIGAHLGRHYGVRWIADLRDSIVAKSDRHYERALVRLKGRSSRRVARRVARRADAIVCVTRKFASEMTDLGAVVGDVHVIPNGADFDDFTAIGYERGERFYITHTGNFFGKRDPRPFLSALAKIEAPVTARFIGEFRSSDRVWAESLGLGEKLELIPFEPHARAIASQRRSDALLLLIPRSAGRGSDVASGKIYEYLAARRPILAAVPPEGAAARLVREAGAGLVVPSDDADAIHSALCELVERWRKGELEDVELPPDLVRSIDRRERMAEIAELIERVSQARPRAGRGASRSDRGE